MLSSVVNHSLSIPYTVRVSRRAKSVRLKLSPYDGLVVVVPVGFDRTQIPALVESRSEWIRKAQRLYDEQRSADPDMTGEALPGRIELAGIGELWRVAYRCEELQTPGIQIQEEALGEVELSGVVENHALCREALEGWLKHRAKQKLTPQFRGLVVEHGFNVTGLSFRKQKSRWGSCSTKGTISLNLKLLFLPPELVRHIMIHELCHTLHMNHSKQFWDMVARFDPDWQEHDRRMRHAWSYVPAWFVMK
ncbi:MAG TPA: M48 family peptidase [Chlorobaculum parvum]|uniref:M48 family peptidase n=1 Tax=Chlorobaculum parvum TaxID=274539 RepID=A0A7C5DLM3_9CHLB|nr:M48 family peptidase [Chlorobaculum parvum]